MPIRDFINHLNSINALDIYDVNNKGQASGPTQTNAGLNAARQTFIGSNRNGPNKDVVILITEGPRAGGKKNDYMRAAQQLKDYGRRDAVEIIVVGKLVTHFMQFPFLDRNK